MSETESGRRDREDVFFSQVNIAVGDSRVYTVQHGDMYRYIYQAAPPYQVEPFPFPKPGVVPADLARVPSRLLAARHQVVPFVARPELEQLNDWRDGTPTGLSVRLLHAEGGQGKTRLAAELAAQSVQAGWTVALARHRSEVASAGGGDEHLLVRSPGLVMIVDYAERWPRQDLITLVRQHRDAARDRLRILLLSRPADEWWENLRYQLVKLDILDAAAIRMQALPDGPTARAAMYAVARDRFAQVFAITDPTRIVGPADLSESIFGLTLTVHMRALVDVDSASHDRMPPSGSEQADLSSYLLEREHDYWRSSHDDGHGPVQVTEQTMGRAVYTATLTRPLPPSDAAQALGRVQVADNPQACEDLLRDHARCYPPQDTSLALEPLYPDRLGEDFIALTLPGHEETFNYYATDRWTLTAASLLLAPTSDGPGLEPFTRQAMTTLIEAARRWDHLVPLQLHPLLSAHPQLALQAGGTALANLAKLSGIDLDVLEAIEALFPSGRHIDLDIGIAAVSSRLAQRRLAAATDPGIRAIIHHNLSERLHNAGLNLEALAASRQATQIWRHLITTDAGMQDSYLPYLAKSVADCALMLGAVGRRAEAALASREAVDTYRELATLNRDAYLPELATTVTNHAARLAEDGRRSEAALVAREAVELWRELVAVDREVYLASLPGSLHNYAILLAELGQRAEAVPISREAVDIYRGLVAFNRDAYLPELANAANSLAILLAEVGQRAEALPVSWEAVETYRELAALNRGAYLPGLAMSLNTYVSRLEELGRSAEAVSLSSEAVGLRRELVSVNRDAYLPGLADSLNNHAIFLEAVGQRAEAVPVSQEAFDIYRELAALNRGAYLPGLAMSLNTYASRLEDVGRRPEAVSLFREVVGLRRELVSVDRRAYLLDLAASLDTYAAQLGKLDRRAEAVLVSGEALDAYRELVTFNRNAYLADLAMRATDHAMMLAAAGRQAEAVVFSQEAVNTYRELVSGDRGAYILDLAAAVNNHAGWLAAAGRTADAAAAFEEAVAIRRDLVVVNRDANLTKLGASLNNYAVMLTDIGRRAEAVSISEESFGLRWELIALNGESYMPDYLQTVAVLGYVLVESEQFGEAMGPLVEALAILQDLPGPPQDIGGMVVNLLRRAFAGDPVSVTSQFREITGQTVPDWMAEAPAAHN